MIENTLFVEKYRPDNLKNYIGNVALKNKLTQYIEEQDIPHLLFFGSAGTGKTTAAKILCQHIDADVLFINASDENGIDVIRNKVKGFASTIGFKKLKIIVLDEADGTTPEFQASLRNLMEVFSASTRFILTCNYLERMISPIVSRCQVFELSPPSKKEVAGQLMNILQTEQITFETKDIVTIINAYYPDIRKIINFSQQSCVNQKLVVNIEHLIESDYKLKVLDVLMSNLPTKDKVNGIRQIIQDSNVKEYSQLYRLLYEKVEDYTQNVPSAILAIAEGQYREAFVIDKEIPFIAAIHNILL